MNINKNESQAPAKNEQSKVFTFNPSNAPIRVQVINQEPWFCGKDVCDALTISNHKDALSRLDDDERRGSVVPTPGGNQTITLVNESGLYNLIFQSRKPEAKAFRKWVTSEVLPQIRKTGSYTLPQKHTDPRTGFYLDLRCEPYEVRRLGNTTVRMVRWQDVEWYSIADIMRAMQVGTSAFQSAQMLSDANRALTRKIFLFGNTHPAWFTTLSGLRLLVSGSRKLKSRSYMKPQLMKGGAL